MTVALFFSFIEPGKQNTFLYVSEMHVFQAYVDAKPYISQYDTLCTHLPRRALTL